MGFQSAVIVSSSASAEQRKRMLDQAIRCWPFIRLPRQDSDLTSHALFSPPEMTDYLYGTTEEYEDMLEQNDRVWAELQDWSRQFPTVTFAYIDADCSGGVCLYSGFTCCNGARLAEQPPPNTGM
ncbi:MAG: hypothetical protein U1F68_12990 [Gammaproteobacteria bacterium]